MDEEQGVVSPRAVSPRLQCRSSSPAQVTPDHPSSAGAPSYPRRPDHRKGRATYSCNRHDGPRALNPRASPDVPREPNAITILDILVVECLCCHGRRTRSCCEVGGRVDVEFSRRSRVGGVFDWGTGVGVRWCCRRLPCES